MGNRYIIIISILLWVSVFILCSKLILEGSTRSVSEKYQTASLDWLDGQDIYGPTKYTGQHGFLYLPQAAILYIPLTILPFKISELLWRLLSIGLLIFSLWKMSLLHGQKHQPFLFFLATVIAIPIGYSCFRNGQVTTMLTAFSLLTLVYVIKEHWDLAVLCLILSLALKPLMIVLVLLIGATQKSMRLRLFLGMCILFLFPFVTNNFHYVLNQYINFGKTLMAVHHLGIQQMGHWAQFFGFLDNAFHISLSSKTQLFIRFISALLVLGSSLFAIKKKDTITSAMIILALATCYILLFNPRTESNGYILLTPSLTYFSYSCYLRRNVFLFGVTIGLVLALIFAQKIWQQVFPAIIFTCLVVNWIYSKKSNVDAKPIGSQP